ncbi:hypothetical protein M409DRAFT_27087 [Zasmidium cellare ATCC 36951]|uniref:X-Pro dipeptidyl-peptidase n=1 Tax=Zasmidium cellare ATCC 36951 TaxID=1080233 RepID=A0A6A6C6I7_ZASCE|nr:uncharacterized protein M409DRAFT_27087 [Zasmidium cellare ATCC 36951]KAF2162463.1 hypothetical protein M409DRAFT_27087 [Zasmidium cellare ATCC 36951]
MQVFVHSLAADLRDIETFYPLTFSTTRLHQLQKYISRKLDDLQAFPFHALDQSEAAQYAETDHYFSPWMPPLAELCLWRQQVTRFQGLTAAARMSDAIVCIKQLSDELRDNGEQAAGAQEKIIANRAARMAAELHDVLEEAVNFYRDYDPVITWWLASPWKSLSEAIRGLVRLLQRKSGNNMDTSAGDIIGQPLGRKAILDELEAECIPYTPEELVEIGEREFAWCEAHMVLATKALGFRDPREALEHTRNSFVNPGEQIHVVHDLASEALNYVVALDLITVPDIAKDCWRTVMMTPEQQRVNPFFTSGTEITVSYPTAGMCHQDKLMSMRGNNPPFSRATVHHELIPGHHLQFYYMDRYHPHRKLFETPFWIEGWALYWEFLLWDRGFPSQISQTYATNEAQNRIGMLFWRMHRCARIIFSIKFHLRQMDPQECVDLLVERVGHERATAEGEVRRSLNGDYSPLYQAGYMLGALQLYALRKEVLGPNGVWTEKEFHDRIMKENMMPIELLRAVLKQDPLSPDWQSQWRFYSQKV